MNFVIFIRHLNVRHELSQRHLGIRQTKERLEIEIETLQSTMIRSLIRLVSTEFML